MNNYIIVKKLKNGINERVETNSFINIYHNLIMNSDASHLRLIKKINGETLKSMCVVDLSNFELSYNYSY